jgi:hypothetical protein
MTKPTPAHLRVSGRRHFAFLSLRLANVKFDDSALIGHFYELQT